MFYSKKNHILFGFRKSRTKHKMYDAMLIPKRKGRKNSVIYIPFGDKRYQNYHDKTGLNLYPKLIHGDAKRRKSYRARHKKHIRVGFYSPAFFSFYYLW